MHSLARVVLHREEGETPRVGRWLGDECRRVLLQNRAVTHARFSSSARRRSLFAYQPAVTSLAAEGRERRETPPNPNLPYALGRQPASVAREPSTCGGILYTRTIAVPRIAAVLSLSLFLFSSPAFFPQTLCGTNKKKKNASLPLGCKIVKSPTLPDGVVGADACRSYNSDSAIYIS